MVTKKKSKKKVKTSKPKPLEIVTDSRKGSHVSMIVVDSPRRVRMFSSYVQELDPDQTDQLADWFDQASLWVRGE